MQQTTKSHTGRGRAGTVEAHVDPSEIPELNGTRGSDRDLLFASDVARRVHMTPAWVYAQARANKIPHVPLGRYVRFRPEQIDAWLAEMERGTIEPPW